LPPSRPWSPRSIFFNPITGALGADVAPWGAPLGSSIRNFLAVKQGRWILLMSSAPAPSPTISGSRFGGACRGWAPVAIKNSVYALPFSAQSSEDFQWLRKEITGGGGEASVCRATFVDGLADPQIEALFRTARDTEYAEVTRAAERVESTAEIARLERRLRDITALDHFWGRGTKRGGGGDGQAQDAEQQPWQA